MKGLVEKESKGCFMYPYKQTAITTTAKIALKTKAILFSSLVMLGSFSNYRQRIACCQGAFYG